jgi:sugar-specific transcriptional regulator TrmB
MDIRQLEELGLTHNEAKTYLALLEVGETKTGAIVKKTGMHRVLIYDALASLIRKGLASSVTKENIMYFHAADPDRLVDFIQEKEASAKQLLPELKLLQKEGGHKQQVMVYEGIRGLKSAMNNMLKELSCKDHHYVFASGNMADTMGPYYTVYQNNKRKKKIMTKVVYDTSFRKRCDVTSTTYGKIKFYPLGPFPTDTWIYKDKALIVTYTAKPPIAILITSKETADSYKRLFEGFWKKAKKL